MAPRAPRKIFGSYSFLCLAFWPAIVCFCISLLNPIYFKILLASWRYSFLFSIFRRPISPLCLVAFSRSEGTPSGAVIFDATWFRPDSLPADPSSHSTLQMIHHTHPHHTPDTALQNRQRSPADRCDNTTRYGSRASLRPAQISF